MALADNMTMAVGSREACRSRRATSQPSISGMATSSRMRFGLCRSASARHSMPVDAVKISNPNGARRSRAWPRDFRKQQLDPEAAALVDLAFDREVAAHDVGQKLGDGQAQTGPDRRLGACRARSFEREKDPLEIAPVDTDAGILDGELGNLVAIVDPKDDVTDVGEFDGVGQQVDQDLPQPVLIGVDHHREVLRRDIAELDALGGRLQAEHVDELLEEIGGIHFVSAEVETSRFDLRY